MKWRIRDLVKSYFLLVFTKKTPIRVTMELFLKRLSEHIRGFDVGLDVGGWGKDKEKYKIMFDIKKYYSSNIERKDNTNILFDATRQYPFKDNTFDIITSFNLIEHLWNYEEHILESHRVLKNKGKFIVYVPFSMFYHPDPKDYWRFTQDSLKRIFSKYFNEEKTIIIPVGLGPFIVGEQNRIIIYNKFFILSYIIKLLVFAIVFSIDYALCVFAYILKRKNLTKEHPLGYIIIAEKE